MLRGLRKASSNWLGKAVMAAVVGFLVISFAIWGIGDIFPRLRPLDRSQDRATLKSRSSNSATIYNDRLQQYSRQAGRPIGPEQARQLGLDRVLIGQIVSEILLDERARALGLSLSDAEVAKQITTDPAFQGLNGQFDRARFEQVIRNAGFTESRFVAEQRRRLLRRELAGTIATGLNAPKPWSKRPAVTRTSSARSNTYCSTAPRPVRSARLRRRHWRNSSRSAKSLPRPGISQARGCVADPGRQARWIEISDADLKRAYEERRTRYVTPERRHVLQIDFPNAEAASAAAERVAKGASFSDIAKELGKNEKDIDLGTVTKAAMIDRAAADAAFALKEGEVSAPVQGRFGTVLVQVLKIEPEQVRSLEQVAGELKQELALARAKAEVFDVYNKIEDARAEGKPLAETAANLKLEARTIEAVDRSGRDPAGAPVNLPDAQRLLPMAFTTDVGVERDPLQFQDGYIWFDVVGITPSRERPLDEVKEQVETRWRDQEIATRLNAKATEIVDKLKGGATLADVATADHFKLEILTGLKRGNGSGPLSAAAVDAVFRTAKDAVGAADAREPGEQVVFRVTDIVVPPLDMASDEVKRTVDSLNRSLSEDLLSEYIARLESEVGVTINQNALNQVVSGGAVDSAN
jgi:peptidyl-prolyl cis-trans isomerase D